MSRKGKSDESPPPEAVPPPKPWGAGSALLILSGSIAAWWLLAPFYDRCVAVAADGVLRAIDLGEGTFLRWTGSEWIAYSRRLSAAQTSFPAVSVRGLHAPVVMLPFLLFFVPRRIGWSAPKRSRIVAVLLTLFAIHVLALTAFAQQIVGSSYGAAGAGLFSESARNAWAGATIAYRVGGRFVAVLLAWLLVFREQVSGATARE